MWTDQMQQSLESKKKGDISFKQKDFKSAIEQYTEVDFLLAMYHELSCPSQI